ncbi:hypothetical protein [Acanthamoeba castellanii mimivirus]|uniref:Uncharacterized protein R874 n=6 Tax=Mimivirus TaxID=315393 RepID=YR874_MIMIV|nr:hypothetical protein MIMI_gp0939 [Acanthamoeba polyphaga mimivirus]Q5URB0.1 RecName: Full=Uncharacterized protein R874 [Acanthamoeba polyphaga mimivirus]ALR84512.1 hypothetical protein [Niemeyer virus]BAV62014.1 hypothetical protein [Acanthamoeba castellanii mimivirus]AAV51132.1 unknown [Acanthamoeba polyphaga mimivirus]ADO18915.1 hypothetical protein [Acanthamoeba polyphaga mimivirus]BAV63000.1 hypothetical protein [Acanthamoeba castellanii mimivirus]
MTSWLCASNMKFRINKFKIEKFQIDNSDIVGKIMGLDINTCDLLTKAVVVDHECEYYWDSKVCICGKDPLTKLKQLEKVECLDFSKIAQEITGGIISSESLRDMYDYISRMLYDSETFEFPLEWDFTFANRYILVPRSYENNSQIEMIKGFCFFADELPFIKPLIVKFFTEKNPTIVY